MSCPDCGKGTLKQGVLNLRAEVKGESFPIQLPGTECDVCGFQVIDSDGFGAYAVLSGDAYRAKHGLLTSLELKTRREQLGMSQIEFACHTKISLPSIKRWELGAVQDEAMDELLRLKTDVEAARRNYDEVRGLLSGNKRRDAAPAAIRRRIQQSLKRTVR